MKPLAKRLGVYFFMTNILKKTLTLLIIVCFFMQGTDISYALRPMAKKRSLGKIVTAKSKKDNKALFKKYLKLHPDAERIAIEGNKVKKGKVYNNVKRGRLYFVKVKTLTLPENLPEGMIEFLPFGRFILEERDEKNRPFKTYYYEGPALSINGQTLKRKVHEENIRIRDIVNTICYKKIVNKILVIPYNEKTREMDAVSSPTVYATQAVYDTRTVNRKDTVGITSIVISNNGKHKIAVTTGDDWYRLYCKTNGMWKTTQPKARGGGNMLDSVSLCTFTKTSSAGNIEPSESMIGPEKIVDTFITKCEAIQQELQELIFNTDLFTPDLASIIKTKQLEIRRVVDECNALLRALDKEKYDVNKMNILQKVIADVIINKVCALYGPIFFVRSGDSVDYSDLKDSAQTFFDQIAAFRLVLDANQLDQIAEYWEPSHLDISALPQSKTQAETVSLNDISILKRLLIFDLDGTLYDCPEYNKVYWQCFFNLMESKGISNQELSKKRKELGDWESTAEFFNVSQEEIQKNAIEHIDVNKLKFDRNPKLIKILKVLKSQGHRLVILTNNNRIQTDQILDKLSLKEGIFERVFTSSELAFPKPNPKAFSEILAEMNIDDPSRVVSIGNNRNTDIEPAKKALGIPGVLIKGPDDIVDNLHGRLKELDKTTKDMGRNIATSTKTEAPVPTEQFKKATKISSGILSAA